MSFIVSMDTALIDSIFSQEHRMTYETTLPEEREADLPYPVERVYEKIGKLPPIEADMLVLYFFQNKDQSDIGHIFSLTQGDVSYRLKRARQRLKYLLESPDLELDQMRADLEPHMPNEKPGERDDYLEIMLGMWETTSQSVVARRMSTTQGRVRYRFMRGLKILSEKAVEHPHLDVYVGVFTRISKSYNILNELNSSSKENPVFDPLVA